MTEPFITSYKSEEGKMHIYFFPGLDDSGHQIAKMVFLSKNIDYRYVKNSDGSIDYAIIDNGNNKEISCRLKMISNGNIEDFNFEV